ncbi:MAG: DIP1984 family protein [Nannocystaceae bacterium]
MKLAEALLERKALKSKMEELKLRLYQNAQTQEDLPPTEQPLELLAELEAAVQRFEELVARINATNSATRLADGLTLGRAILRKDMLRYTHLVLTNLADKATPSQQRYSQREIKQVPAVNVTEIRRRADEVAREARLLDARIQEANWQIEVL